LTFAFFIYAIYGEEEFKDDVQGDDVHPDNDIVFTQEQKNQLRVRAHVLSAPLWPNGIVPYKLDAKFSGNATKLNAINAGIAEFNAKTCIRFVPAKPENKNFVNFVDSSGCQSNLGMTGGSQNLLLSSGCGFAAGDEKTKLVQMHEMMHALGFMHENQRPDRDSFIILKPENMVKSQWVMDVNFKAYPANQANLLGFKYDYTSIMHYGKQAFMDYTIDKWYDKVTIQTKDPAFQEKIGQRAGLSNCDVVKINKLYNCTQYKMTDPTCVMSG